MMKMMLRAFTPSLILAASLGFHITKVTADRDLQATGEDLPGYEYWGTGYCQDSNGNGYDYLRYTIANTAAHGDISTPAGCEARCPKTTGYRGIGIFYDTANSYAPTYCYCWFDDGTLPTGQGEDYALTSASGTGVVTQINNIAYGSCYTHASPSSSPSAMPSIEPSDHPSTKPSVSPSDMPSTEPSDTPSCTPSEAPTPSPSLNLFYPDQQLNGFETGCLNDGEQPSWMDNNPSWWLFSSLEACCNAHYAWNIAYCLGLHDDTCARAYWYPDWEGENKSCKRDGDEPVYMTSNPSHFLFSSKSECCEEHYSWNLAECKSADEAGNALAGGAASYAGKFYADWTSGAETCQDDGNAPQYMKSSPDLWLSDDRDTCCSRFFPYKYSDCIGGAASVTPSGHYYPDWDGDNEGCLVDDANTPAPQYMTSNHLSDEHTWLHQTLEECCEQHYAYRIEACKGVTSPASAGSHKWYIDWNDKTCRKDCVVSSSDSDCGGLAGTYEKSNLHDDKRTCCNTHMSYDFRTCFT